MTFRTMDGQIEIGHAPEDRNIIYNAFRTPDGTVLVSLDRHDYRTHEDKNGKTYMIDGGTAYLRRSTHLDQEDLTIYDDAPHDVQRDVVTWGTYGKDGKQPYTRKKVKDMSDEHIKAVLSECVPALYIENCMKKELELRDKKVLDKVED